MGAYIQVAAAFARAKLHNFLSKENGEVNVVAIVVLIGVAVLLAILFRDAISTLLEGLLETISGQANDAVTGKN